jgi:hypothetical protein
MKGRRRPPEPQDITTWTETMDQCIENCEHWMARARTAEAELRRLGYEWVSDSGLHARDYLR